MKHPNTPFLFFVISTFLSNLVFWNGKAYGITDAYSNAKPTNIMKPFGTSELTDKNNQQQPTVVICGGGPGGLLASVLLSNIGIQSTVIEQSTESTPWGIKSYTIVLNEKGKDSLDKGGCLEAALEAGQERQFTVLVNPQTGDLQKIPNKPPNLAITRHDLVQSIEKIACGSTNVTFKKGVGISCVIEGGTSGLVVQLEDGSKIPATHVIGADGKWSKVRESFPSFSSTMETCPSSAVHLNTIGIPPGWDSNGTYLIRPMNKECKFYVIGSALPDESGMSLTMVYFDQMLEKHPWLQPAQSISPKNYIEGWNEAPNDGTGVDLASHLKTLFEKELPAIAALLDETVYRTAVVRRRATWLRMEESEGTPVNYSSNDGRVSLIGDAAHAMTASIGEGCNTALDSAVKLVDSVVETMKEKDEKSCTAETMSLAFARYGSSRPKECIVIQEKSASRSTLTK